MTRNARLWTGSTLLLVIAINYAIIAFPLLKKSASIKERSSAIFISRVKSGEMFRNTEEDYVLEIFRKEKRTVDKKMLILNSVGLSMFVIIASWTAFGLVGHRRK